MAESANSVPPIPPSSDVAAMQHAQISAANTANNAAFLSEIVQANLETGVAAFDPRQANTPNDFSSGDPLLSLDTPSLSLFNEIGGDPRSTNITGNLTAQQMQAIGILLKDEQGLEEAANLISPIPLTSGATTVDLSVEAQNIAFGLNTVAPAGALPPPLTPTQLEQIGAILAPLANAPLTQPLLLQIQAQLTATGLGPLQFSLSTLVLVMNYMAAMQPAATHVTAENKNERVESEDEETVAPAASIDRVAVEDNAILSG